MNMMVQEAAGVSRTGFGRLWETSERWRRRPDADRLALRDAARAILREAEERAAAAANDTDRGLNHGLTEDELRALIAQDLRAFVRRPMAPPPCEGPSPERPFLLDRLVFAAS
jgi:hypothetical protein